MSVISDIKKALDGPPDDISDRLATILTLSALLELSERVANIEKMAEKSSLRLGKVEFSLKENPPILFLLKNKPRQTLIWIAIFFLIMAMIFFRESRETLGDYLSRLLF